MMSYNYPEGTISYVSVLLKKKTKKNVQDLCPYGRKLILFGVILDSKKKESQTVIEEGVTVCRK